MTAHTVMRRLGAPGPLRTAGVALALVGFGLAQAGVLVAGLPGGASRRVVRVAALTPAAVRSAEAAVRAELARGAFPGAALGVGIGGRVDHVGGVGRLGWSDADAPVSPDSTLYDLASLTKAVATTLAVFALAEDGRLRLDDPVRRHLPEFAGRWKGSVTWRHLLTHSSGLPGGAYVRGDTRGERLRGVLRTALDAPPGETVEYTDVDFIVLYAAAERAAGEPLPRYLERRIWGPLGMDATRFSPGMGCAACAPTLRLRDGTPFRGKPHDVKARRLDGYAGNAGLFSAARDLARLAAMLANGGELDGVRVLRRESVREMLAPQPGAGRRTPGWAVLCPDEVGDGSGVPDERPCRRPQGVGHNGYTGTSLWIDPATGAWVVLLTNRTYGRPRPADLQPLREELFRIVRQGRGTALDTVVVYR